MNLFLSILLSVISALSAITADKSADMTSNQDVQSESGVTSFASADTKIEEEEVENLFTRLDLAVASPETGKVAAALKNTFTLFSSTVPVRLCLYSSLTKATDIAQMTLEASAYSSDLNMNESLIVTSSTHGEDRYWIGYAIYYKNNARQTYQTDPYFYYADGTYNPAF